MKISHPKSPYTLPITPNAKFAHFPAFSQSEAGVMLVAYLVMGWEVMERDKKKSEASVKKIAKDIYCTSPVIRMKDIARRVGRSIEEVCRWRDEEFCLQDRALLRDQKKASRIQEHCAGLEDPAKAAAEMLRMLTETRKALENALKRNTSRSPEELRDIVQSQAKVLEMTNELYERLGLPSRRASPLRRRRTNKGKFI